MRIEMVLFYDFEMTGLHKDTTPISLGIVSEDGKKFYAEFLDYNKRQCSEWILENVIPNLNLQTIPYSNNFDDNIARWKMLGYMVNCDIVCPPNDIVQHSWVKIERNETYAKGDARWIFACLDDWLKIWRTEKIQFVSDVCHYDFVLLIDLLTNGGTALDLPENISAVCHDINHDIARHFCTSDREAFDMSREQIMNDLCGPEDIVTGNKHNSLYDAEVIRAIWKEIH